MSTQLNNPYAHGTAEHTLWARWHRAFFNQPIHGQLLAIESQLRQNLTALFRINAGIAPSEIQQEMRSSLLEVEESVNLLNEAAEHAFFCVVSHGSQSLNGRKES